MNKVDSNKENIKSGRAKNSPILTVGLGASAGGLDAFQEFLKAMPADSGMSFVLVQHLDPTHETMMPELLRRVTDMPVEQVKDKTPLEANHIYFIPPNSALSLEGGYLRVLTPEASHGHRTPIDRFFYSLAEDCGENSAAVVLSGTGSDGTLGIRAVKEAGGLTVAEASETAKYDSMPRSAASTGMVDYVLPVNEIPRLLLSYAENRDFYGDETEAHQGEETQAQLKTIFEMMKKSFNHDFSEYKLNTLVRRIRRRMQMRRANTSNEYIKILRQDKEELQNLFKDFLIGVTYFFRDKKPFEVLEKNVIPEIVKRSKEDGQIRVWVPGCASGEEVYSIAILISEACAKANHHAKVQIFGTDIDERSINVARKARYPIGIVEHVDEKRLDKFFVRSGTYFEVAKHIREMCLFSTHDLVRDPPFAKLDLISFRNVMIYMKPELQQKILPLFNYALKPDGYLLLGPTESIGSFTDLFKTIDKQCRIYRNKISLRRPAIHFPLTGPPKRRAFESEMESRLPSSRVREFSQKIDDYMLSRHLPPFVVINANSEVQYFSDGLEDYLSPSKGAPNNNLIQMLRKSLRVEVRSAVQTAIRENEPVTRSKLMLMKNGQDQPLRILIEPFTDESLDEQLFVIIFEDMPLPVQPSSVSPRVEVDNLSESEVVQSLETELQDTKFQLQTTIEDLEHANEELRSTNEELLSMNEELQSTNEELQTSQEEMQSVNEELETVNTELSAKVELLDQANSDLNNLFESIQIATLFLDGELRIKRFTSEAKALFRIVDGDLDRPITDFAPRFSGMDLEHELKQVIRTLATSEKTVSTETGNQWYRVRIHPYKTVNNVIEGAVVTFYDITALKRVESELNQRLLQQSSIARLGAEALKPDVSLEKFFGEVSKVVRRVMDVPACAIMVLGSGNRQFKVAAESGFPEGDLPRRVDLKAESLAAFTLKLGKPVIFTDVNSEQRFSAEPFLTKQGFKSGISLSIQGVEERPYGLLGVYSHQRREFSNVDAQFLQTVVLTLGAAVERHFSNRQRDRLANIVQTTQDIILSHKLDGTILHWNPAAERIYGYRSEDALGRSIFDLIVPADKQAELKQKTEAIEKGEKVSAFETERLKQNGERVPILLTLTALKEEGRVIGVSAIGRDISARRQYEKALINAKDQASAANELKSRFLGVLSHELRTPLSSVMGFTELALQSKNLSNELKGHLERVETNAELIHSLLEDLMDISRIEGGQVKIEKKWFPLKSELSGMATALGAQARSKDLKFNISTEDLPEEVNSDPVRLRQIILNMVSNSIKYTHKGTIELNCWIENKFNQKADLMIRVKDTGIGIPSDKRAQIFEPFFRANPGLEAPGVGLGLYLTRQLARLLGGGIELEPQTVESGTSFLVHIPIRLRAAGESGRKKASNKKYSNEMFKGLKILVADDVEDLRGLMQAYLSSVGAKVDLAEDGKEALEKALNNSYDIIILDLVMPGLSGKQVLKRLQQEKYARPVLAVTAQASDEDRRKCLKAGFCSYLPKPVDKHLLLRKVRECMDDG